MIHAFDSDVAVEVGLEEAIFIQHVQHWAIKNRANSKHFRDDRTWTYNSVKAYTEIFPYWTEKQIRRIIESLLESGILLAGEFNENRSDRTKWYAFADEKRWLPTSESQPAERPKAFAQTGNSTCPNGQLPHLPKRATLLTGIIPITEQSPPADKSASKKKGHPDFKTFVEHWSEAYQSHFGRKYDFVASRDGKAVKDLLALEGQTWETILEVATRAWSLGNRPKFNWCKQAENIFGLRDRWNSILNELNPHQQPQALIASGRENF